MSANYQESAVAGTKWKRCVRMVFGNPFGGVPTARFEEEEAIAVGDQTLTSPVHEMFIRPFSAEGSFPLRDPQTGATTGATMTHTELATVLYSLYMAMAIERDGA